MKTPFRLFFSILLCSLALAPKLSAQVLQRNYASLAFPFTVVATGASSNILGVTTAVGNPGVFTPAAAFDVPRTLTGLSVSVSWEYAGVTNGVAQTGFFLQGSVDGTNWNNTTAKLLGVIQPAQGASTNVLVTTTNFSNALLCEYRRIRWAAGTNGGQPSISNFVSQLVWEQ